MTTKNDDLARVDTTGDPASSRTAGTDTNGSAHTPGPWEVSSTRCDLTIGGFKVVLPPGRHASVAYVATDRDARLIAAAPDLLAALKETRTALAIAMNVICSSNHATDVYIADLEAAGITDGFGTRSAAVIEKAEGRS